MQDWSEGKLDVIVSTMNCGFNCGKCDEAMIAGGVRSVADAILKKVVIFSIYR